MKIYPNLYPSVSFKIKLIKGGKGVNWNNFKHLPPPDISTIPSDYILSVAVESDKKIWIGTYGGGWAVLDYSLGSLSIKRRNIGSGLVDNSNGITAIAIDNNHKKWLGTYYESKSYQYAGLIELSSTGQQNNRTDINTLLPPLQPVYYDVICSLIILDSSHSYPDYFCFGGIYDTTPAHANDGGLFIIHQNLTPGTAIRLFNFTPPYYVNTVTALFQDGNDLWVGTYGGGIGVLDLTSPDLINSPKWLTYDLLNLCGATNLITSIVKDNGGNFWIGTEWGGGLVQKHGTHWAKYVMSNSGLPDNYITSLAIENIGSNHDILWIGTRFGGLASYDLKTHQWITYNVINTNNGLPHNFVTSIAIDKITHNKWIGTYGGFAVFNENGLLPLYW